MKIGLNTDSLGPLALDEMLDAVAGLGVEAVEFATGAWSNAPHLDLDGLLGSGELRRRFLGRIHDRGLAISALTCSGNPLHPGDSGPAHDAVTRDTIRLAPLLGVDRVVLMSGCPGAPGDRHPNWITVAWPPEVTRILDWQWSEVLIPYWEGLVSFARSEGLDKLCLEMHGQQNVYNVDTLLRLRAAVGPTVGANFDPSHLMWMGADPLAAIRALGDAIYHVHAKDTRVDPINAARNSRLETRPADAAAARSWNYVTLGYGHGETFWSQFCRTLREVGYDDVLSIEHEDVLMAPLEGIRKSVELLRRTIIAEPASYRPPEL